MRSIPIPTLALVLFFASGCGSHDQPGVVGNPAAFVQPTIAVMKFENRASFPLGWDLGSGLQDVLVHRLVATGRYHVIERPEIEAVLRELHFQQSGLTRAEEKAALGSIKNVQYLIKGTITDFAHVSTERGFLGIGSIGGSGGSQQAVMGITMYVVEVQSGEIVCSESIQQTVDASDLNVTAIYKNVAFGGSVFYRTPLGQATAKVIDRAVSQITTVIGSQHWEPRIARIRDDGSLLVNGGTNRELTVGREFEVLESGVRVIDPVNGDTIGTEAGKVVGRLRISEVQAGFSVASLISGQPGSIKVGQACRGVEAATSPASH